MKKLLHSIFLLPLALLSMTCNAKKKDIKFEGADVKMDISYDKYGKTKFDIILPKSDKPTPLVIYIHGGGFVAGDKGGYMKRKDFINDMIKNNIAVATINYRLISFLFEKQGVIKCLKDSKRCLQYIRSQSKELNIDKERIVLIGGSAGAGTCLWLATHDDMKDPDNEDPVLRESTRVRAAILHETQATYEIERWFTDVFEEYQDTICWDDYYEKRKRILFGFYGVSNLKEYQSDRLIDYRKEVDMLTHITEDDPEMWISNTHAKVVPPVKQGVAFHHAYHAREIHRKAQEAGVKTVCYYGKNSELYKDESGETQNEFIIRKLTE